MCFSATASFVAGGALSATGAVTLKKAKTWREAPLASVPLLLGIQQIIEGMVWISFGKAWLNTAMTYAYTAFSHVLWPVFFPVAVFLIERDPIRKKIIMGMGAIGLVIGAHVASSIAENSVTACVINKSIDYTVPVAYPYLAFALYAIAVCGVALASSHKIINIFGVVLVISAAIAGWLYMATFFSVWCFFAAILSVLIYWYFRKSR